MGELLVHAEEIAYFACANADVACRNVFRRADDLVELGHERLAEAHHFVVGTSADREVRAALAATHWQSGESVLEGLLETEELQYREVYRRMETQATLVRANGAVELHAITDVYVHLAFVVYPRHTESQHALWLYDALDDLCLFKFRMLVVYILY